MGLRFYFFSLCLLGLLVGCSQGDKSIDKLIVAFDNMPRTLDPRFAIDANSQYLSNLIHCSLIEFTPEGGYQNQLAHQISWKDPTTLVIKLKEKVRFSNSKPLTSRDIKATFDFFIEHPDLTPRSSGFQNLKEVKIVSANEVEFLLKKPDAPFIVNNLEIGILPQEQGKILQPLKKAQEIIGCGPYRLVQKNTGKLILKKNGKFFLKSRVPRKDELEIKIVKDEGTRFLKLQKGEVHLAQNLSREKIYDLSPYPQLTLKKTLGLNTAYLAFNMQDKIVGNLAVRKAIAYALKRDEIIEYVLRGMAEKASQMLPENSFFHTKTIGMIEPDLALAKKLLDQAGFTDPDGDGPKPRMVLNYKTTTDRTRVTIAKTIVSQLAKIGIKVNLQTLDWGKFKKDIEEGKGQIWSLKWIGYKDPDILRYAFHSQQTPPQGGNRGSYQNSLLDQLLEQGLRESSHQRRKKIYDQANNLIAKDFPYIFLWHEEVFAVLNNSLTGYQVYADGRYQSLPLVREKALPQ